MQSFAAIYDEKNAQCVGIPRRVRRQVIGRDEAADILHVRRDLLRDLAPVPLVGTARRQPSEGVGKLRLDQHVAEVGRRRVRRALLPAHDHRSDLWETRPRFLTITLRLTGPGNWLEPYFVRGNPSSASLMAGAKHSAALLVPNRSSTASHPAGDPGTTGA